MEWQVRGRVDLVKGLLALKNEIVRGAGHQNELTTRRLLKFRETDMT